MHSDVVQPPPLLHLVVSPPFLIRSCHFSHFLKRFLRVASCQQLINGTASFLCSRFQVWSIIKLNKGFVCLNSSVLKVLFPDRPAERCCYVLQKQSNILDLVGGWQEGENKHTQSADTTVWFTKAKDLPESHIRASVQHALCVRLRRRLKKSWRETSGF